MAQLHLKGYICTDHDGIIALRDSEPDQWSWNNYGKSIIESIEEFAEANGMTGYHHNGLGGKKSYIDDCIMRAFFTDVKCELREAMLAMDLFMYGGDIKTKVSKCGYSEWTITGLNLDEFTIGGHSLRYEFSSHAGKYCHLIIEC